MDNFVTEIIPYGHENAITRAELATRLGESDRVIRAGINKSEELIINLQHGKGYFKPLPEEGHLVKAWIKLFESRVKDESRRLSLARGWKNERI